VSSDTCLLAFIEVFEGERGKNVVPVRVPPPAPICKTPTSTAFLAVSSRRFGFQGNDTGQRHEV
jgi:hypothetical protein